MCAAECTCTRCRGLYPDWYAMKLAAPSPSTPPIEMNITHTASPTLTPQAQTVLAHMRRAGGITQREALMDHSIQSLTRRVTELKDAGYPIERAFNKHPLTGQRYARYSLSVSP